MVKPVKFAIVMLFTAATILAAEKHKPLTLGGCLQPRWEANLATDSFSNSFGLRRTYIGVGGELTKHFGYGVRVFLAGKSVALYRAFIDIKPIQAVGIKLGQFQTPIGMEKLSPVPTTIFPERSYVSGFVTDCDLGIMSSASVHFVSLQAGLFNGTGTTNDNPDKDFAARLTVEPWKILHLGGAYQRGVLGADTQTVYSRWGAEFALNATPLHLAAEYAGGMTDTVPATAYYADVSGLFKLNKAIHALEPAVRYEWIDRNTLLNGDSENALTAGINVHFMPQHKAKLGLFYRTIWNADTAEERSDQIIAQFQLRFST